MKTLATMLCSMLAVLYFGFSASHAGWMENGLPITHQYGAGGKGVILSDSSSGAIIAYEACHEGFSRIVTQRIDSLGVALWGPVGVRACASYYGQEYDPCVTSDGAGGAIVAWRDCRSGDSNIYVQRVNASGDIQWTADGVALCAATGDQEYPQITSDGAGGALVTWEDYRNGSSDIYAQRVNASGDIQWAADGVALCTATGNQTSHGISFDGMGGAIVVWVDENTVKIRAQRVDGSGAVQWGTDGIPLCAETTIQMHPEITSDNAGGAIIAWQDSRGIYIQRVNASGAFLWMPEGVAVCGTGYEDRSDLRIASDGVGGAIVMWIGIWTSEPVGGGYVQRISASGEALWAPCGVEVGMICIPCQVSIFMSNPQITSDGAGGVIAAWQDSRSEGPSGIRAQRVNAAGDVQWPWDGVLLCEESGNQDFLRITCDGAYGAIVTWEDHRSGNSRYAQRVSESGIVRWATDGVPVAAQTWDQGRPAITFDGANGAVVAWAESRGEDADIYAQHLSAAGEVLWAPVGVSLCTASGHQSYPEIASDGSGGAIVAWKDSRGELPLIYVQRVNAAGDVLWTPDGVPVGETYSNGNGPAIISDGAGGAIVMWNGSFYGSGCIHAQRVNASGSIVWQADGISICAETASMREPLVVSDGAGGAIVTWEDSRGSWLDIYAQRVSASGSLLWTADGVRLSGMDGFNESPAITSDAAGGAIVAWQHTMSSYSAEVYAQRVNASGSILWAPAGVPLCPASEEQWNPIIASDNVGRATVAWMDNRGGYHRVYAQRLNALGAIQWPSDGVPLCAGPEYRYRKHPAGISDGTYGAIVTWYEFSDGDWDIYAQRVNSAGIVQWTVGGVFLGGANEGYTPQPTPIVSDGLGGALAAWQDQRCGSTLIYAQRITASGELLGATLQNYSVVLVGSSVHVAWTLAENDADVYFSVLRASAPEWEFAELAGTAMARNGSSYYFIDASGLPGSSYRYRIECETEGTPKKILFESADIAIPALPVTLFQNHPNPFNPSTTMRFYIPEAQEIVLDVYNVAGERVARLAEGKREKGYHEVAWDGRSTSGADCASGVYFCRLTAGKVSTSRKIVIMR